MKFGRAMRGTRGDIEPCAAVDLELLRRGHEVRKAVPPNVVGFVESAGLAAVGYGPDSHEQTNYYFARRPLGFIAVRTARPARTSRTTADHRQQGATLKTNP
jgi:UDP:flavonoid glycosyltransferase YjiC (YdhE family)